MPTIRDATWDTSILAISRFSISISNIVLLPILTKGLGSVGYGIWVQAWVLLPLLASMLDLGLPNAMLRFFLQKDRQSCTRDFYRIVIVTGTLSIGTGAIFWLGAPFFPTSLFDGNEQVIRIIAALIPIWVLGMLYHALLQSLRRMRDYGVSILIQNVLELGLAGLFISMGWGIEGAVGAILLVRSTLLVALAAYVTRFLSGHSWRGTSLSPYFSFSLPLIPMNVSSWAVSYIDRFLIAIMVGTAAVGNYDPAYTIGRSVPFLMASVMGMGLLPSLASMYDKGDRAQVQKTVTFMLKALLLICIPFVVGGYLLATPILATLTTAEMAEQGVRVLPLVALALTIHGCKVIISQAFYLEKRTKTVGWTYSLAAAANAAFTIALIPVWGIEGAAVATVAAYLIDFTVTLRYATRELLPRPGARPLAKIIMSTAVMAGTVALVMRTTPSGLVVPFIVGIAAYSVCIRSMSILDAEERALLRSVMPWNSYQARQKSDIVIFGSLLDRTDECMANKIRRLNIFLDADVYSASRGLGWHLRTRNGRYTMINTGPYLEKYPLIGHINQAWGYGVFKSWERSYDTIILSGGIESPYLDFLNVTKCVPFVSGLVNEGQPQIRARRIAPFLKGAIAETPAIAEQLRAFGLPDNRLYVITPIIDPSHLRPLPPPTTDTFHILFASSPLRTPARPDRYRSKGVPLLLEAFSQLLDTHAAHLTLLWRQDYYDTLMSDIATLGISAHVTVVNERVDIEKYYQIHHCVIIPYVDLDGGPQLPLSALESLAHARPVVATDIGNMSCVRELGCGVIAKGADAQSLRDALATCINDYPHLQKRALECQKTLFDEGDEKYNRLKAFLLSLPNGMKKEKGHV